MMKNNNEKILSVDQQKQIHINEEYYDLVPRPLKEERQLLKESIILHGQREPIVINSKGEVLDGHTRFEICQELGLEPKFVVKNFADKYQEKSYVIGANLERRQLSKYQKFELVYNQYLIEKQQAIHRRYRGTLPPKGRVSEIIGKSIGMSSYLFDACRWLHENANEQIKKQLREGKILPTSAYKLLRPNSAIARDVRLRNNSIVKCPHCLKEFERGDLIVVKR
jgi:hypothetical protein